MSTPIDPKLRAELEAELALLLDRPVEKLLGDISPEITGKFLSITPRTLSIWRCTGRYNLPYFKAGRMVRYRIPDVIEFKARRIRSFEGEIGSEQVV